MIFDGKKFAFEKEKQLKVAVAELKKKSGVTPKLLSILIGDNPASRLYLRIKEKAAERVGIIFEKKEFSVDVAAGEIIDFIEEANKNKSIRGIMVQLPFPEKFRVKNSEFRILESISPGKDVDCLNPENFGLLAMGKPRFLPATVRGILEIVQSANLRPELRSRECRLQNLRGANVCVVGASNIVGKPLALVLSNMGATVTICRSRTKNLGDFTSRADLLISATGVPGLIKKEMVKRGAVVIDVGSPKGDVDFENVRNIASFITPVPGGVGPATVVCLFENLVLI